MFRTNVTGGGIRASEDLRDMKNYEKPELLELGLLTMTTLSSSGSSGKGKGDDNGEDVGGTPQN